MKTKLLIALFASFVLLGYKPIVSKSYKIDKQKTVISVSGTSSLHDWEINVKNFEGDLYVQLGDNNIESISSLNINFFSKSFSSGKALMDSKTKESLKADTYPMINFKITEIKDKKIINKVQQFTAIGKLTIVGVTKSINITALSTIGVNGEIYFQGTKSIDMTEYGITPPTAMLGSLKTGKDVTVTFKIFFH
ncbi:MAG: YceI family protein [Bacteroidetes bacterium]|nr:YceI family protein [Bacteroidota bacterium]